MGRNIRYGVDHESDHDPVIWSVKRTPGGLIRPAFFL